MWQKDGRVWQGRPTSGELAGWRELQDVRGIDVQIVDWKKCCLLFQNGSERANHDARAVGQQAMCAAGQAGGKGQRASGLPSAAGRV